MIRAASPVYKYAYLQSGLNYRASEQFKTTKRRLETTSTSHEHSCCEAQTEGQCARRATDACFTRGNNLHNFPRGIYSISNYLFYHGLTALLPGNGCVRVEVFVADIFALEA